MSDSGTADKAARPVVRPAFLLLALDVLAAALSIELALRLRFGLQVPLTHQLPYVLAFPLLLVWRVFAAHYAGLYDLRRNPAVADHLFAAPGAALVAVAPPYLALALLRLYYLPAIELSRTVVVVDACCLTAWFAASRAVLLLWMRARGQRFRVVVVGPRDTCVRLLGELRDHAPATVEAAGYVTSDETPPPPGALGDSTDLLALLDAVAADKIILVGAALPIHALRDLLAYCDRRRLELYLHPDLDLPLLTNTAVASLGGVPLVDLRPAFDRSLYRFGKRLLDMAAAAVSLVALSPVLLTISAAIALTSPGGVFFVQERVGRHGRVFRLVKFRSMRPGAENNDGNGPTAPDAAMLTPAGRWLRKTRLDEAPQLWNVLTGRMSLVGPRPERPVYVARFKAENPLYERRLLVRPGLTGLAQVHGRHDTSYEQKLRYDLIYINGISFLTDLRILLATIRTVLTGHGAQ